MIEEKKIKVNGKVVGELGVQVDPGVDVVEIEGKKLLGGEKHEYWVVNKPKGVISTVRDTHGRKEVTKLVNTSARLFPVGRLDEDSRGLLLLTNDGDLAYRLTHPKFGIEKEYVVRVTGKIDEKKIKRLRLGIGLEDGRTAPARVERVGFDVLKFGIKEGRKRQIRRMCSAVGLEVVDLVRVKMGGLELGDLVEGKGRKLNTEEVESLENEVEKKNE